MKKLVFFMCCFVFTSIHAATQNEIDSLLKVLDKTILERSVYAEKKTRRIDSLKLKLNSSLTFEKKIRVNESIIHEYESFLCDSAITYIDTNIEIAEKLNYTEWIYQSKLESSFVLSLSGSFTQALEVLNSINFEELPMHLRLMYCWTYIRYYENLIKYTNEPKYGKKCLAQKMHYRNIAMSLMDKKSDMYLKEQAFKLQDEGKYTDACLIFTNLFAKQKRYSHDYAMSAMSLAVIHKYLKNKELEEKFLALASITDTQLAVKDNEALLALAINLYEKNNVDRAYNYIKVALDDANLYNSRFKNTVIARIHPLIENTYLNRIEQQKQNLRLYAILISAFVVILIIGLFFIYKQIKIVSRARKSLKIMNAKLYSLNQKLDEANLIKEKYIGYFMSQCAVYLDRLDEYRKNVNRKIKAGQTGELHKLTSSTRSMEKDIEELYETFDRAFLKIYPNFVDEFNALLREEEHYKLEKEQLNTELRIFALIRLGITDVNQIATFLRYSIQTIYNYRSKVKAKTIVESENFEDKVRKIGTFSYKNNSK